MPLHHDRSAETGPHAHETGQLFVVRAGTLSVAADHVRWLVPAGCMGWVPPGCAHEARYPSVVEGVSAYVEFAWSSRNMPRTLKVVTLTPLVNESLVLALDEALPPARRELYWHVLADALTHLPAMAAGVRMPQNRRLLRVAQTLLAAPDDDAGLDVWALRADMSRSTFIRHFQAETGLGFGEWRQQLRVWHALGLLAEGRSVTEVALAVGYRSPSAFIQVFRRLHGVTPSAFSGRE
ncbi:AraC family transcriptional regulator [Paludibacterium purpuratum]|nr:AraC family transcriptional regulator [Paludibacterium purpuratum]